MTNEREKEEKAALHGLLDQIQVQVRHQKLGLVRKWSYFYFFLETVCLSVESNVKK